jgi:hypothetical protein
MEKIKISITIFVVLLMLQSCASTPATIAPEMQFGYVLIGGEDGNQIIIPNLDEVPAYNIYRQKSDDTTFIFIAKEKRPPLPMRYRISPYAVEWADGGFRTPTKYKAFGLKDNGTEWFEVKLEYRAQK